MIKKNSLVILCLFFFAFPVLNSTVLDQAKWLLKNVDCEHGEEVGACVGHSLLAIVDLIFFPFGWMDLCLNGRFVRAHNARLQADRLVETRKNLKKLIWFLKSVEEAFLYIDKLEANPNYLQNYFNVKFALALNELRHPSESIADTVKRIHLLNQAGANFEKINTNVDYYSTIRGSFCKRS